MSRVSIPGKQSRGAFYDQASMVTESHLLHILLIRAITGPSDFRGGAQIPPLGGRNVKEFKIVTASLEAYTKVQK